MTVPDEEGGTRLLIRLVVVGVALWLTILLLPGLDYQGPFWEFVVVAAIFAVVNAFIRPVAQLLSLPITILTLGLFALVVNALMFLLADWLASDVLDLGLRVDGFWAAFFGALVDGAHLVGDRSGVARAQVAAHAADVDRLPGRARDEP